ncbi:MAG: hypothetical protein WC358_10840 [Ignavibacteria bacterium]|jgi:hypothetical protein
MLTAIITPAGANIHIPGMGMKAIPIKSPIYEEVVAVIMDGINLPEDQKLSDSEKIHRILRLIDRESSLRDASNGKFEVIEGNIKIDGEFIPQVIAKRIIDFMERKYDFEPLIKFWGFLRNNPTERSRTELLAFLEKNGIPITNDGHFVAYKYLNSDFSACADSSYKNLPGNIVSMDRDRVDAESSRTCSNGLHVASWDYVKNNKTIVSVKVNPVDVVSIPYDYNGQKMRVCRYQVIDTITGEYTDPRFNDEPVIELDCEHFEYLGIHGSHKELRTGDWIGYISHKHRLLNEVVYRGNSLNELHDNFINIINEITKDTRFNYLRQRRDDKGGFVSV